MNDSELEALELPPDVPGMDYGATITPHELAARNRARDRTTAEVTETVMGDSARDGLPALLMNARAEADLSAELQVRGVIGEGGMGQVLLATQKSLRRDVAIKTLKPEFADKYYTKALLHEAVLTGSLEHPNIVPVHAVGLDQNGKPLLVMKKIDGVSWETLLDDFAHEGWQPLIKRFGNRLRTNVEILMDVCDAVEFAHSRGILHRDIKPANVMIGTRGDVYLVDWGVAVRMTDHRVAPQSFAGTPSYMAPEMISNGFGPLGPYTDVYLLGATLHRALTGLPPHRGGSLQDVLANAVASVAITHSDRVPRELTALCHVSMQRESSLRLGSAAAFRERLVDCMSHVHSVSLAGTAVALLGELRALLVNPSEADPLRVARVGNECRFAFGQALREWDENLDAKKGLQDCLDLLFDSEIARNNFDAAAAVAAEMTQRNPAHDQALNGLADKLKHAQDEAQRLQAYERDLDFRVSSQQRFRMFMGVTAVGLVLTANSVRRALTHDPLTAVELTKGLALIMVILLGLIFLGRRAMLGTTSNRRVAIWSLGSLAAMLGHRLIVVHYGLPLSAMISVDFLLATTDFALGGALISPVFYWPLLTLVPAMLGAWIYPQYSAQVFGVGLSMGFVVTGVAMFQRERSESRQART